MKWLPIAVGTLLLGGCAERDKPPPQPHRTPEVIPTASVAAVPDIEIPKRDGKVRELVLLSDVYEVDKIYPSMTGPHSTKEFPLEEREAPKLLWIVGFEAIMVDKGGDNQISQEFMCHANLDMDPTSHHELFNNDKLTSGRLFTLSQGQYRIDMPRGFGIPILTSEILALNTQALNLNMSDGKRDVRHKIIMRYQRDDELKLPIKPLYVAGAYGLKLLEGIDGHYGREDYQPRSEDKGHEGHKRHKGHKGHEGHGDEHAACLPGENAGQNVFDDGQGRKFTGHWVVKPGKEVNHTNVTKIMDLPWDTTLHYVAVHLHPFAEKLTLKDLTTGDIIYTAKTRQVDQGIGLAHVDFFSSEKGIPLYKDHEYEIISEYNNTSGKPQDSMAVMNLYLEDKEFNKPDLAAIADNPIESAPKPAEAEPQRSPNKPQM